MLELGAVDRTADAPVFRQIADDLRAQISRGFLAPGDQLPSESVLMAHYEVARMTARSALEVLAAEGTTIAEHGRGVFVRERPPVQQLSSTRLHRARWSASDAAAGVVDQVSVGREQPSPRVRELLGLAGRRKVVARHYRAVADGAPVELTTIFIPLDIAGDTALERPDTNAAGVYAQLEQLGHRLGGFSEQVAARMPSPDERKRLRLIAGTPVILTTRVATSTDGRPVAVTESVLAADRFVLDYQLPAE